MAKFIKLPQIEILKLSMEEIIKTLQVEKPESSRRENNTMRFAEMCEVEKEIKLS